MLFEHYTPSLAPRSILEETSSTEETPLGLLQQDPSTWLTLVNITLQTVVSGQVSASVPPHPFACEIFSGDTPDPALCPVLKNTA